MKGYREWGHPRDAVMAAQASLYLPSDRYLGREAAASISDAEDIECLPLVLEYY